MLLVTKLLRPSTESSPLNMNCVIGLRQQQFSSSLSSPNGVIRPRMA